MKRDLSSCRLGARRSAPLLESLEDRRMLTVDVGVAPGVHLLGESISVPGGSETYQFELLSPDDLTVQVAFSHAAGNLDVEILDDTMSVIASGTSSTDNETVQLVGLAPGTYFVRVFAVGGSTNAFDLAIDPGPTSSTRVLYVNDGDATADVYTLAPGDDLNDGLSPSTPKASLQSLYDDHDIGPTDLVVVDTGIYPGALLIQSGDEAGTLAGSPNHTDLTATNAISLEDADFNLIYGLRFINNSNGIFAYGNGVNDSTNNTFLSNYFQHVGTSIRIDRGASDLIEDNTIVDTGSYGVRFANGGSSIVVRNNDISSQSNAIYGTGHSSYTLDATVDGNTITGGSNGVYLASYTGGSVIQDNVIAGTTTNGIFASSDVSIINNSVSAAGTGIHSQSAGAAIVGNAVSGSAVGIYIHAGILGGSDWTGGQPNDIDGNVIGVQLGYLNSSATARFNRIHGNVTGIEASSNTTIHHNLIYRNTGEAILIDSDNSVDLTNNTIYATMGDGVIVQGNSQNVSLTNNILWSETGTGLYVATNSQRGFQSDYNNLYTTSGTLVWWQKSFTDLFDWQVEANYDTHSIGYTAPAPALDNPLFVSLAADDYHLQDALSTSIDAGDPASAYALEPGPAGDRVNLGAYGGTTEAALSRSAYIALDYPNYYTDWEATVPRSILWHSYNVAGNIDIEVYLVGGGLVDHIDTVDVNLGSYSWSPAASGITPAASDRYYIRLTSLAIPAATDDSREGFSVPLDGPDFYVDDTDPANIDDEYTLGAHGDNRNTGKTTLDPKANLLPLLRNYDLGPGDTVHIDTGDYVHVRNVVLSGELGVGDDEGAAFTGPTDPARIAHIDRANPHAESTNIELNDADFVTLRNLTLTGAERGLWVHNGSTNFSGESLTVSLNSLDGIIIESDAEASAVDALTATDNGRYGIRVATALSTLSNSVAHDNGSYGMYLTDLAGGVVSNNLIYANGSTGLLVSNYNTGGQTLIRDNTIYGNVSRGISATYDVLVEDNEVFSHDGVNEVGIEVGGNAIARGNIVHSNYNGIVTSHTAEVEGNRVYNNLNFGIAAYVQSDVVGNHIYSNGYGIRTDYWSSSGFVGLIGNNLVYDSTTAGVLIEAGRSGARIWNNTIFETQADGLRIQDSSSGVNIRNNIIWVDSDHAVYVANDSQSGFDSDYNLLYATGTGAIGYWQNNAQVTLIEWRSATLSDAHSRSTDPDFVNPVGGDGLLGYTGGVDHGGDDDFHLLGISPAIDAGDLQSYYLHEILSGGRTNQGAYGNTTAATFSPAELVQVLFPNGDERLEEGSDYLLRWRSYGLTLSDAVALINSGTGGSIDNWLFDSHYINGLTTSTVEAIDLGGVLDPAPLPVYQTYRYANNGVGNTLDYQLHVPDGDYSVRLHFVEPTYSSAGSRVFDISLQGALQIADYDIYADAGDRYTATTQTFSVTAAGGGGIGLQFLNKSHAGAIVAAIEVTQATAAGVPAPTVDLDLSIDGGASWSGIASGQALDHYGRGELLWTAAPLTSGLNGLLRVSANDATMPVDVSDGTFEIVEPVNVYYVNDSSVQSGDWTTAAGSDANDGRMPSTPMATISAVLAAYDLEAGDVVKVDSGIYNLANNIIIGSGDAGVQIEGYHDPLYPARQAILDRGNLGQHAVVVQATDVTLSYLWITGGRYGVNAVGAANLTIEHGKIYGNDDRGISLDSASDGALVSSVTLDGDAGFQAYGIWIEAPLGAIIGNSIFEHQSIGIEVRDSADQLVVVSNEIYGNNYGIRTSHTWGSEFSGNAVHSNTSRGMSISNYNGAMPTLVAGNLVYENDYAGIEAVYDVLVTANTVYNHSGSGDVGIIAGADARVTENLVHGNYLGIATSHTAAVVDNRIYNNSYAGVDARVGSVVAGNLVYSNSIGIRTYWWSSARFTGELRNNIVYDNSVHGMQLGALGSGSIVANNTLYQIVGDAIHVQDDSIDARLRSNILIVESGAGVFVENDSQTGFSSDYNLFFPTGSGVIGNWEGIDFSSRADWFYELGLDAHGRVVDPLLVNPVGVDGILGYSGGTDYGLDDDFHIGPASPALDGGDPLEYFFTEPSSGGRINIGAYGNTSEAALSADEVVQVLSPNGLEKYEFGQSVAVDWRSFGLLLQNTLILTNSGGAGTIDNWLYDRYHTSGSVGSTAQPIGLGGVTSPAPMEVYQSYRYASNGVGSSLSYRFDAPDGIYTFRLHFAEPSYNTTGSRIFDILAQGALQVDDFDIVAAAGARYEATTVSFSVTAVGGLGIDLNLVNETNAGALVSAIELTAATANGVASPTVNLDLSTDSGGSWGNIASAQPMDAYGRGSYLWAAGPITAVNTALMRARANDVSMPLDSSDDGFLIANSGPGYYVNDASLTGDFVTSALGDNLQDGKTAGSPMGSLRALLNAYDLDAGDIVYVDTGDYHVVRTINIGIADGGVTIQGPDVAVALLNRANAEQRVVDISGDDVTLRYLELIGGYDGIRGVGATGLVLEHLDVHDNDRHGLLLESGSGSVLLSESEFHHNGSYGAYMIDADFSTVQFNEFYENSSYGLYTTNSSGLAVDSNLAWGNLSSGMRLLSAYGSTIHSNEIYDNGAHGIQVSGLNNSPTTVVHDNLIHGNANDGLNGSTNVLLRDNQIYGHVTGNSWGVYVADGTARDNVVYGNHGGIATGTLGRVTSNRVFDNSNVGIAAYVYADVEYNHVYSNSIGIMVDWYSSARYQGRVQNNLIYANSNEGLVIEGGSGAAIFANNTIYQEVGNAVRVQQSSVDIYLASNILWVADGYAIWVHTDSEPGFHSDYNLFHLTGVGKLGQWQDIDFLSPDAWRYELGLDQNSVLGAPLFVDIDGADGLLGYTGGADYGADDDFHLLLGSPAIDAGDPNALYLAEPDSGGRVNIGRYGNTASAAASADELVHVISPNGFEKLEAGHDVQIEWIGWGLGMTNSIATMNVGDGRVGHWDADRYALRGSTSSWPSAIDTSGVSNAAPMEVYQTYRYAPSGIGATLDYTLDIPDGVYMLTLHFADNYSNPGSRVFDIIAEGVLLADNYDIAAAAGTSYTATTLSLAVVVGGGDGMALQFVNETNAAALVNAIEISATAGGVVAPTFAVDFSDDLGGSWSAVTGGVALGAFNRGSYTWNAGPVTPMNTALLRVTANDLGMPQDASDNAFLIASSGTDYYINDGFVGGDVLTSAIGDDANDGKTTATPMATLWALISAYSLEAGDIIHVDTGDYRVLRNVEITSADAGVFVLGASGAMATFDRLYDQRNVFDISGADSSIGNLRITGGNDGISVAAATGVAASDSEIFGNRRYGIVLDSTSHGALVSANNIYDNGSTGFYSGSTDDVTLVANDIFSNSGYGIYMTGTSGSLVDGNDVHDNSSYGINLSGASNQTVTTVSGNTVHGNFGAYGISASTNVVLLGNDVYEHDSVNQWGIALNNAEARQNNVHGNHNGILTSTVATVVGNRVFNNEEIGISTYFDGYVRGNYVYSNSIGIKTDWYSSSRFRGEVESNLVYSNTNQGILAEAAGDGSLFINNTIYQEVGDALRFQDSALDMTVRNNIFWIEKGYALHLHPNSQGGFDSNYNLFQIGMDPDAHLGYFNSTTYDALATWQTDTLGDVDSLAGMALFVDPDGADDVIGYDTTGNGYDGGPDDNFQLSGGSPAIDRAQSFLAPPTDIVGNPRLDDPGTPNLGGDYYVQNNLGMSLFGLIGTAQNWQSNNTYWSYTLPFTFSLFGVAYTQMYVSTEGFVQFGSASGANDNSNTTAELIAHARIAVLWDNIRTNGTGDDIFIDASVPNQLTVRWDATNEADGSDVNIAITLYDNNEIEFHYGSGNTNLTPTIGIAAGDGSQYLLASYDGMAVLTDAESIRFDLESGFIDMGAYEFQGSSTDTTPPIVTATDPSAVHDNGGTNQSLVQIVVHFSEALDPIDGNALANYDLRSPGLNGLYDDGDDVIYTAVPNYSLGDSYVTLSIQGGGLPEGDYRLQVSPTDSLRDTAGNPLDGDNDGNAGGAYEREFSVDLTPPSLAGSVINGGLMSRSWIETVDMIFDEEIVPPSISNMQLVGSSTGPVDLNAISASLSYTGGTYTLTLTIPSRTALADDYYTLSAWSSALTDPAGNALGGVNDVFVPLVIFHKLVGDIDGDSSVGQSDLGLLLAAYNSSVGDPHWNPNADLNGNGSVDQPDLGLLLPNYGVAIGPMFVNDDGGGDETGPFMDSAPPPATVERLIPTRSALHSTQWPAFVTGARTSDRLLRPLAESIQQSVRRSFTLRPEIDIAQRPNSALLSSVLTDDTFPHSPGCN